MGHLPPTPGTPRLRSTYQSLLTASLHLFGLSLRRQLLSRQTLISVVLTALSCLSVVAWSMQREPSVKKFAQEIVIPVHAAFLVPIFAICYGAASVGGDREDQTLVYLLITPLPRPMIYVTKSLVATSIVVAWALGTLAALCGLGGSSGREAFQLFWLPVLIGTLAYVSLFHTLGAAFRRGTIISLAYAFFLEVLLGNMPGIVKRVSLSFYLSCMMYDAGSEHGVAPLIGRDMFLPISGRAAAIVLGWVTVALFAVGVTVFTRREYLDLS